MKNQVIKLNQKQLRGNSNKAIQIRQPGSAMWTFDEKNFLKENQQALPSLEDAMEIVDRVCYVSYDRDPSDVSDKYRSLLSSLNNHGMDTGLLDQYVSDAQLDDDDEQKEGMNTSNYLDMAHEELKELYSYMNL